MRKILVRIAMIFLGSGLAYAALGAETSPAKPSNIYSPVGKRDPFRLPTGNGQTRGMASISPLERFNIEQLNLKAILRTGGKSRAMFEDPDGKTHIVFEGDILGRERAAVSRIETSEVILTQRTFNYLGQENLFEKVISLPVGEENSPTPEANGPAGGGVATGLGQLGAAIRKIENRPKELERILNENQGIPNK